MRSRWPSPPERVVSIFTRTRGCHVAREIQIVKNCAKTNGDSSGDRSAIDRRVIVLYELNNRTLLCIHTNIS